MTFIELQPSIPSGVHHPMLSTAIDAAMDASTVIAQYFHAGVEIRSKAQGNLVTNADVDAEKVIVHKIHDRFPHHAILAEEDHANDVVLDDLWIVDPLDGTNNFAHQIPHFAVSIAYYHQGIATCGVVTNPVTRDWYIAVRGQGTWFNGKRCHVNSHLNLNETMIGIGFYYDRGAMMEATLAAIADFFRQQIHGVRRFGTASLDLGCVARGLFGLFFEYQLAAWDFGAGRLLVEEAGGCITDCSGNTLPFDQSSSLLATNGHLHPSALAIAQQHWNTFQASRQSH